ncbi:hypothetical protein [Gloeobacter morelensis]|uniref:Uncharacterized protein n=1 Tax=Gloeobacter morelensis MG652769 TaxID=2781736 RepID=A0ABY3PSL0_9CYAN|nr:hypothetical protein [Gloeobacter morelensis]UFP96640.1 hypothetical protein ISF26_10705 [Gloeobacter morelensis MG652769]
MAIHVKIATTAAEREAIFRFRHRIFAEERNRQLPKPITTADRIDSQTFAIFPRFWRYVPALLWQPLKLRWAEWSLMRRLVSFYMYKKDRK